MRARKKVEHMYETDRRAGESWRRVFYVRGCCSSLLSWMFFFCSVCSVCCCVLLFARPQPSRSSVLGKLAAERAGWSFVAFLFSFCVSFSGSLMRSLSCFFSFLVELVTCVFFLLCLPSFFLSLPRMHGCGVLLECVRDRSNVRESNG